MIFVIDEDGVVHEREVETGILDAKKVEIKSGLDGDERIVTGPYRTLSKLKDGETVRVKKPRDSGDEGKKGDDKPAGPPEEGDGGPEKASADPAPGGAEKSGGEEPGAGPEPE